MRLMSTAPTKMIIAATELWTLVKTNHLAVAAVDEAVHCLLISVWQALNVERAASGTATTVNMPPMGKNDQLVRFLAGMKTVKPYSPLGKSLGETLKVMVAADASIFTPFSTSVVT